MEHGQYTGYKTLNKIDATLPAQSSPDLSGNAIVQTCLTYFYTVSDEEAAIAQVMAYLGTQFSCARVNVFSIRSCRWVSTDLEWCADGVSSQKSQLNNEPLDHLIENPDTLRQYSIVQLLDVETIRTTHPTAYALMKSRQAHSTVSLVMQLDHGDLGMFTLENPAAESLDQLLAVLQALETPLLSQIKRRHMLHQLEEMSFHDPLTGAYNRNALSDLYLRPLPMRSVGVIFCDVSGLKQVNDTLGHEEGDAMIVECYHLIQQNVRTDRIYRMGGDEFLALCCNCTEEEVQQDYELLKRRISESPHHIAVGYVWSDETPLMLEPLVAQADQEMYRNKQAYYSTRDYFSRMAREVTAKGAILTTTEENSAFQRYLRDYYFDAEALMRSLTVNNTNQFFFFGDIQKNYFYISDLMRDRFGFESNLILNLPHYWEKCICDEEYRLLNNKAVERLFDEKQDTYEVLHILQDVHGNRFWAYNSGTLQWNADHTAPLFLAGRITMQDKDYSVDQISGFQKDHKALAQIEEMQRAGQKAVVIAYCMNHFDKLNRTSPTYYGNLLVYHTGRHLVSELGGHLTFYRLDGVNFMAILHPDETEDPVVLLERMRAIIEREYENAEVGDANPASFALLEYESGAGTPQEFLETVYETIDTARQMPNLPYLTVSEERRRQVEQTERMLTVLRKNILNNMENFRILVQPAVKAGAHDLAGGEVLLYWTYEGQDILPPVLYPLLENEDLLAQVNRWIIEQVFSAGSRLHGCAQDFIFGFNVSAKALCSDGFIDFLRKLVDQYGVRSQTFFAEVLESNILNHSRLWDEFSSVCGSLGIHIMQKRFASLNAPFRALMERKTEVLKLDLSLVEELPTEAEQEQYMKSLVYSCHTFGKRISLCGVENEEIHKKGVACGFDYLQGNYHYRPMELSELYALLLR